MNPEDVFTLECRRWVYFGTGLKASLYERLSPWTTSQYTTKSTSPDANSQREGSTGRCGFINTAARLLPSGLRKIISATQHRNGTKPGQQQSFMHRMPFTCSKQHNQRTKQRSSGHLSFPCLCCEHIPDHTPAPMGTQVHWSHFGQVLCHHGHRGHDRADSCRRSGHP